MLLNAKVNYDSEKNSVIVATWFSATWSYQKDFSTKSVFFCYMI